MVNLEKTSYLAKQKFSALIFGEDHPYANRIEESDYQRITVSLIRDFYHRYYQAGQFRIFICGHVNEGLLNTVTRLFGNLPIPSPGNISKKLPFHAAQPGRYHVSKENCVQSSIRIGKSSVRLTDDDYAGYMLLNTILGGYFGSRLMSNIREEKGYTYPVLMDTEGELFASYGIMSFPTTFMIDRDGNVFGYVSGMLSADMMDSIVRQTLDGKMDQR